MFENESFFSFSYLSSFSVIVLVMIIWPIYLFPLVWPPLMSWVESNKISESAFAYWAPMLSHELIFIILNGFVCIIYYISHPYFEQYKIHDVPWPWKSKDPKNKTEWRALLNKTFYYLFINQFVLVPIFSITPLLLNKSPYRLDSSSLPSVSEYILQIILFTFMEDFFFYWSHRILHNDLFYGPIHKIHHSHINVISLASEVAHPVEFFIGNLFPTNSGPLLLGLLAKRFNFINDVHMITLISWIIIRIAKTTDAHSGYLFPFSPFRIIPLQAQSSFHNYHHLKFQGNYGSFFTIWDQLGGTVNPGYYKFIEDQNSKKSKIN